MTPLQSALARGKAEIARMLIERGANVEAASDGSDWSPLHYCAANDLPDIARLLLEHGANPNARLANGDTPLKMAVAKAHDIVAATLRDNGGLQ
ncbi:hypothetical protein CCAX7_41790 [Capsulimonas corticalis]|uniref:Uncharacterized protein n=1 Tax=Capsulimonas corticalis TaxID=2219043 RepID=A0A402CXX1_9BACT|nr:hypothetical protein CCAX7_41790 [Capsulimonas corticalis]